MEEKKRSRVKTNKKYFVINYFVHNILFNIADMPTLNDKKEHQT